MHFPFYLSFIQTCVERENERVCENVCLCVDFLIALSLSRIFRECMKVCVCIF